jgi:hypothetical protein
MASTINIKRALKNVINYLNTNIYSYLETSGGQSFNLCFNVVHFLNTSVNKMSVAARTVVFLHWCLLYVALFISGAYRVMLQIVASLWSIIYYSKGIIYIHKMFVELSITIFVMFIIHFTTFVISRVVNLQL